jgi:osmoprotectant transport system permease protein
VNLLGDAIAWLTDPDNWDGRYGIGNLIVQHLRYSAVALLIAVVVAVPLGYLIGHTGRGRNIAVALTGAARALPSLGLVLLLVLAVGVTHTESAAIFAFVLLGVPPILAGAYSGVENVDKSTVDAARAMGMTEWQILRRVEAPLGFALLIGGVRSAALQIIATVTIAGYVNLGALGYPIIQGIQVRSIDRLLGAALLVVVLALLVDAFFALLQRFALPRGVSGRARSTHGAATGGTVSADPSAT